MDIKLQRCPTCLGSGKIPDFNVGPGQLRAARMRAGVSLRELAAEIGLSFGYIGDVERGDRKLTRKFAEVYMAGLEQLNGK